MSSKTTGEMLLKVSPEKLVEVYDETVAMLNESQAENAKLMKALKVLEGWFSGRIASGHGRHSDREYLALIRESLEPESEVSDESC